MITRRHLFRSLALSPLVLPALSAAESPKRTRVNRVPGPRVFDALTGTYHESKGYLDLWLPERQEIIKEPEHHLHNAFWAASFWSSENPWPVYRTSFLITDVSVTQLTHAFLLYGKRLSKIGYVELMPVGYTIERSDFDGSKLRFTVTDKPFQPTRGRDGAAGITYWQIDRI